MKLKKMQEDIENAKRQEAADKKREEDAEKRRRARIQRETKRQEEIKRRLALDESIGSLLNKSTKTF